MSYPKNDDEYEETTVKAVREGCFDRADGWTFSDHGAKIAVGDKVRFYGRGIGCTVRGLFVNGKKVFYRTEEEDRQRNHREAEARKQKKRNEFAVNKANMDMRFADLPEVFQRHPMSAEREGGLPWQRQ